MHAAMRPYVTAGVALVGASAIAVTPIAPAPPDIRSANPAVRLAAASIANVPANLIEAIANMPAHQTQAIQQLADALVFGGSWNVSHPNNVWGWDPANPDMLKATVNVLVPFPALSVPLGEHLNWWVAANFPMYAGCTFECPDPIGMFIRMFTVGPWEFYDADGYTFPEVINPIDGTPTEWSEQTVKLDPLEPFTSVIDYLMADPSGVETVTPQQLITTVANLAAAFQISGHLPPWIAVRELEEFFLSFLPTSVTSTPSLTPESGRVFTLDAAALHVSDGDARQNEDLGNQVASPGAQQNGLADAGAPTESRSSDVGVLSPVPPRVAPEAGQRPDNASTPLLETLKPTTSTSTNETSDGNMVKPGQVGTTSPNRLDGAMRSIGDRISSRISDFTNRLAGGNAQTGTVSTGDTGE